MGGSTNQRAARDRVLLASGLILHFNKRIKSSFAGFRRQGTTFSVKRERGTGNREQGTGNREQGTGNREQGRIVGCVTRPENVVEVRLMDCYRVTHRHLIISRSPHLLTASSPTPSSADLGHGAAVSSGERAVIAVFKVDFGFEVQKVAHGLTQFGEGCALV